MKPDTKVGLVSFFLLLIIALSSFIPGNFLMEKTGLASEFPDIVQELEELDSIVPQDKIIVEVEQASIESAVQPEIKVLSTKKEILTEEEAKSFAIPVSTEVREVDVDEDITQDKTIIISKDSIASISITGSIFLLNEDSLVRIVAVDEDDNEFLVFESTFFPIEEITSIINYCEETCNLNNANIEKLSVQIDDAVLKLDDINIKDFSFSPVKGQSSLKNKKKEQQTIKLEKIRQKIQEQGKRWQAAETKLSKLSYAEKKELFVDKNTGKKVDRLPNLKGLEYYDGGSFERPEQDKYSERYQLYIRHQK
jgi:hypothetical protein